MLIRSQSSGLTLNAARALSAAPPAHAQTTSAVVYATKLATATSYWGTTANVNGMADGGNAGTFSNTYTGSAYAANFWFRHTGSAVADFPAFSFPLTVRCASM